jgi:hypothetical protein
MPTPDTQPIPNKRGSQRRGPKANTRVICYSNPLALGPNLARHLLDLSESGVRLLTNKELKVGQHIAVEFSGVGRKNVVISAAVVWVKPAEEGQFCVGAKFEKDLPWADLLDLARIS